MIRKGKVPHFRPLVCTLPAGCGGGGGGGGVFVRLTLLVL